MLGMWWHIGDSFKDFDDVYVVDDVTADYNQFIANLSGLAFVLSTNVYFALSASVLLSMPT